MTTALMQYMDDPKGADKYHGPVAEGYDAKREGSLKWQIEQRVIEEMLTDKQLPVGSWVLDIPCGTGRFFKCYHDRGFIIRGMDKSADMLRQASSKVVDPMKAKLDLGDVRRLELWDKSVDVSVMCRLTRWLEPADCVLALNELQRVTRKKIISTWRVRNHPHARSYELINSALNGWKISRDEAGVDMDYRIIEMRPC